MDRAANRGPDAHTALPALRGKSGTLRWAYSAIELPFRRTDGSVEFATAYPKHAGEIEITVHPPAGSLIAGCAIISNARSRRVRSSWRERIRRGHQNETRSSA